MLFKKKPRTINQLSAGEDSPTSRAPRYNSVAWVRINGFEGKALLRNISTGGFRMESRTYAAIAPGEHYTMRISHHESVNLDPFTLGVEVRWVQSAEKSFNAGFLIVTPPTDGSLENYITLLSKTHSPARV
jgi:hypothetical protein